MLAVHHPEAVPGERRPRVLPIMEIVFTDQSERFPIYSFKSKFESVGVGKAYMNVGWREWTKTLISSRSAS